MTMDDLAHQLHATAVRKGFYDHADNGPSFDAEKLALIHSEVSEALEALRDGDETLCEEELADIVIRVLDFAEFKGFSMDRAVAAKALRNDGRPRLHGRQW